MLPNADPFECRALFTSLLCALLVFVCWRALMPSFPMIRVMNNEQHQHVAKERDL